MNVDAGLTAVPENLPGWRRALRYGENLFVVVPLALCALLPLLEIILRRFHSGLSGSILFVQNFTLVIGMAGAAIAARAVLRPAFQKTGDRRERKQATVARGC